MTYLYLFFAIHFYFATGKYVIAEKKKDSVFFLHQTRRSNDVMTATFLKVIRNQKETYFFDDTFWKLLRYKTVLYSMTVEFLRLLNCLSLFIPLFSFFTLIMVVRSSPLFCI